MGKKDKKYGPSAHPRSSFQLRSGGGNMNPYAKIADKGLINPSLVTKPGKPKRLANKGDAAKKAIRKQNFITGLKTTAVLAFPFLGGYITKKARDKAYNL